MPKGPNGEYRPADVVGCAVKVAQIATGEVEEGVYEYSLPEMIDEKKGESGKPKDKRAKREQKP